MKADVLLSRSFYLWTVCGLWLMAAVCLTGCPGGTPPPMGCASDAACDDGDACTTDTCNTSTGVCANTAIEDCADVEVTASVTGEAVPGGTVTATAAVDIRDGSSIQTYSWSQSNSVAVTLSGTDTETVSVTLPDLDTYKAELLTVLREPPISEEELPENVPLPEGEFPGGLQDRFHVVGLNPFTLEETGVVSLAVSVTTSSGTYTGSVDIHTELPFNVTTGLRNVPVGVAVLLHGKTQASYDWSLVDSPSGSSATLVDATSQDPYFTPDETGVYTISVTDNIADPASPVTLDIVAGTWEGAISGQDSNGRPLSAGCTICHNDTIAPDKFTEWAQTGHAEIFTDNLNTSTHYGESCFTCHVVGFLSGVDNGGGDEAADYDAFLAAGLLNTPAEDNWTTMLTDFPETARFANVQCEQCHGPHNSPLHANGDLDPERISLSSDVCASCHGEPLRHARFQQWQLSGHANYELAIDESQNGSCARCHTVNGFLAWLPVLLDNDPNTDPLDDVVVTWTPDESHPQTCVACHDPHSVGTTTGVETNAEVRISGDTPPLIAGFQVTGAGRGAICMTCHNSRRGLRNDDVFDTYAETEETTYAPHGSAQTDVLMGQNAYFVDVGTRSAHSLVEDACVNCHMEQTSPPELLSYQLGGTNHTFFARGNICVECHASTIEDATATQTAFQSNVDELQSLVEAALLDLISDQIAAGRTIDLNGEATITDAADVADIAFGEARGRQAITVTFTSGATIGPVALNAVDVLDGGVSVGAIYDVADERLVKAGWNLNLAINDGSRGVHYPSFVRAFVNAASDALRDLTAE